MATRRTASKAAAEPAPAPAADPKIAEQVRNLASLGLSRRDICRVVSIKETLLDVLYREEYAVGFALGNANLAKVGFQVATGRPAEYDAKGNLLRAELPPDRAVLIFLHKARLGFRETSRLEHTGADGAPLHQAEEEIDLSVLTDEEFKLLEGLRAKAKGRRDEGQAVPPEDTKH